MTGFDRFVSRVLKWGRNPSVKKSSGKLESSVIQKYHVCDLGDWFLEDEESESVEFGGSSTITGGSPNNRLDWWWGPDVATMNGKFYQINFKVIFFKSQNDSTQVPKKEKIH